MKKPYVYLGIDSSQILDALKSRNINGSFVINGTLEKAYEFGDIVISIPTNKLSLFFSPSASEEMCAVVEKGHPYTVNRFTLKPEYISVHYKLLSDGFIPICISHIESNLKNMFNLDIFYEKQEKSNTEHGYHPMQQKKTSHPSCPIDKEGKVILIPKR